MDKIKVPFVPIKFPSRQGLSIPEIEKRIEELRVLYTTSVGPDREMVKKRGLLLKWALERKKNAAGLAP
jgi:hypothetical protein